jgi:hypothetical protein
MGKQHIPATAGTLAFPKQRRHTTAVPHSPMRTTAAGSGSQLEGGVRLAAKVTHFVRNICRSHCWAAAFIPYRTFTQNVT